MNKKYDLTGMRFGTLAVTGFNGRDKDGHLQWNCYVIAVTEVLSMGLP